MTEALHADMASGLNLLRQRIADVPEALERAAAMPLPAEAILTEGPVTTTGVGGSEGPARVLAAALRSRGIPAAFEPLASFASEADVTAMTPARTHLVIVSQGLSPNARIALGRAQRFRRTTILTSVGPDAGAPNGSAAQALAVARRANAVVLRHGPDSEHGLLARILGPSAATVLALRCAGEVPPTDLADRHRAAFTRANALLDGDLVAPARDGRDGRQGLAFVTAGAGGRLAHGLRWKVLEATGIADPPVWDVLQFAHGPFQQTFERPLLLCALERRGDAPLFDRLEQVLVRGRHRLVRACADLAAPWSLFEHDAWVNALVLALHRARPYDLTRWPGQGADAPLYTWSGCGEATD